MLSTSGIRQAACRGQGPADFVRGPKSDYEAIRELCETCPVRRNVWTTRWPTSR